MQNILNDLENYNSPTQAVAILQNIVTYLRPSKSSNANKNIDHFIQQLQDSSIVNEKFKLILFDLLNESDLEDLFTDKAMHSKSGIFSEVGSRIGNKILPRVENNNSLYYKLKLIFNHNRDSEWLKEISEVSWLKLFNVLQFNYSIKSVKFGNVLIQSLSKLSYRLTSLGLENDLRLNPEHAQWFISQNRKANALVDVYATSDDAELAIYTAALVSELMLCKAALTEVKALLSESGTSLNQTFIIKRAEQQLNRILIISDFTDQSKFNYQRFLGYFKNLIYSAQHDRSLRALFSDTMSLVAYQIAENKSHTGEHYIANDRKEYWKFFVSSCGGGLIISFTVIVKLLIHKANFAPFWEAIAFSVNYALAFIAIQICGFTLATKQPAMTASTIAASMDNKHGDKISFVGLAIVTAKVVRSQVASFTGNLLLVFPVTLLWFYILQHLLHVPLVHSQQDAISMFKSNHPLFSFSLIFAAFTGIFLFVSGIISGYVDSLVLYMNFAERIKEHPFLKRVIKPLRLQNLALYLDKNMGGFIGNAALGFILGTAGFIGFILGLPYDIRHITIASGLYSISAFELHQFLSWKMLFSGFLGVLAIGFINFLFSFSIAFYVALKSRNIKLKEYANFLKVLFSYLFKHPFDFIFPPKSERQESDLISIQNNNQNDV